METFILQVVVVLMGLLIYAVCKRGISYLKSKTGKGILAGLILAPLALVVIVLVLGFLTGCSSVPLSDPHIVVFGGIESTKNLNPQCEKGGASDRIGSNVGLSGCAGTSSDGNTITCAVYRHHSCAIGEDDRSYDAFGVEVRRRFYLK